MDRDALLLYLRNVRDLEVARYKLKSDWLNVKSNYQTELNRKKQRNQSDYADIIDIPAPKQMAGSTLGALLLLISTMVPLFSIFIILGENKRTSVICIIVDIFLIFTTVIYYIRRSKQEKKHREKYKQEVEIIKKHNLEIERKAESKKQQRIEKVNENFRTNTLACNRNLEQVNQLIDDFYNMNIIPSQYRTLPAIHYIYEYMSTSQASLQDTLIHEHMENGIVRLEGKLNEIIYGIEDMVYQTRCINQKADEVIQQNNKMLSSLRSIESNSQLAAQYAELSANYNKANAYFSAANYLKR